MRRTRYAMAAVLAAILALMCIGPALGAGSVVETWIQGWDATLRNWKVIPKGYLWNPTPKSITMTGPISTTSTVTAAALNDTRLYWVDDFMEAANLLASTKYSVAYWTGAGTSGTQTIVAGLCGEMQLATTGTANRTSTLTFTTANFDTDYASVMETRVKTSNITNSKINFGWYDSSGADYLMFESDTTDDANHIAVITNKASAGEVRTDTEVHLVAATYRKFRLEIDADEGYRAYIDGALVKRGAATALTHLATLKPYFYVDNKAATEAKILSIDYVKVWQNRP
jgi:hypothetical protein